MTKDEFIEYTANDVTACFSNLPEVYDAVKEGIEKAVKWGQEHPEEK